MEIFRDDTEYTDIRMVQRVVDMFERRPRMQRIVKFGLLGMEYDDDLDAVCDDDDDDYDVEHWVQHHRHLHGYPVLTDRNDRGLGGNHTRSPGSAFQHSMHFYTSAYDRRLLSPSVKVQAKESDTERKARLLQEAKKSKEKTEKKRLKKQKQKERRRLERMEKEKQNPVKNVEGTDDPQQSKANESKPVNAKSKDGTNTSVQESAQAKDTESSDSSEDESSEKDSDKEDSGDSEELDLTSTFVSKAALIARRKLEQKSRPERKEKKKIPVKETKTLPVKRNEDQDVDKKKDSATSSSPTFEDNIKMSTDLAVIGNQFASTGEYNMAVKYFTDAIRYNPKEFKLFGNRSFCFEKMQEYEKALTDAELSLSMFPGWVKGLYRKGRALAGLKRYEEASQAFREVLKLDSACTEAAQELMRVQITQLMEYGFSREQSSNALIIHGTVNRALEVLSKLNQLPGAVQNGTHPTVQVANVTGTSPVLSANANPPPHHHHPRPQSQEAPKIPLKNKPLGPAQNMSNVPSEPKLVSNHASKTNSEDKRPPPELFPVWVGNLFHPVTESSITDMFSKVGNVYSTKLLSSKRCAFVNFTKQEYCDEAIRRFNGFELMGTKIAVRYPDRIPQGMGISKSALKAEDLQDENLRQKEYADGGIAGGSRRPIRPYRHVPDHRGPNKY